MKKNKKTYKELVATMEAYEKEITMLDAVVRNHREHLERLSFLVENYIEMKKDIKKFSKYIDKKIDKEKEDGKENRFGNQVQSM